MLKGVFTCCLILIGYIPVLAQGARNIKINEVMTANTESRVDDYNMHLPWVEIANISYTTYNIRGMFVTTNRAVLDKSLSAPERIKLMSIVPNGEEGTVLKARQHAVFYLNSNPAKGAFHLSAKVNAGEPVWIALYDGNGVDLLDSVQVPGLIANTSYARYYGEQQKWGIKAPNDVTPGTDNFIMANESKTAKWKREDPHGFALSLLSMGIVFGCLILLYVFFTLLGKFMRSPYPDMIAGWFAGHGSRSGKNDKEAAVEPLASLQQDGTDVKDDEEVCMAVIAMALHEYLGGGHDNESGIITIKPKQSRWGNIKS